MPVVASLVEIRVDESVDHQRAVVDDRLRQREPAAVLGGRRKEPERSDRDEDDDDELAAISAPRHGAIVDPPTYGTSSRYAASWARALASQVNVAA